MEETFTLEEIKEKIEITGKETWKPFFEDGVKEMEVEAIEKYLPSQATKEDIRHDFSFYTPSCRNVRVKVSWLFKIFFSSNHMSSLLLESECECEVPRRGSVP